MISVYTYIGVVFVSVSSNDVQNCSALIDECAIVLLLLPKLEEWLHDYNCQYIFESNIHRSTECVSTFSRFCLFELFHGCSTL